jgi:uncharacterized protein YggE
MKTIVVGCSVMVMVCIVNASPLPEYPLVFARGDAQTKVPPDICVVNYQIKIRDKEPTNALSVVELRSAQTLAVLAEHGVKKEDIVGFEIDKDVVRDYEKRDQLAFLGYEMTRRIQFTLHDLGKYEPIVSVLLKTPDVTDIRTSFDRTDRKAVESRLLAEAVADAKAKAELMAQGSGQKIVKLRAISQHGFYNLAETFGLGNKEYDNRMYSVGRQSEKELLFVPSTIEFRNGVSVIYEIEGKK